MAHDGDRIERLVTAACAGSPAAVDEVDGLVERHRLDRDWAALEVVLGPVARRAAEGDRGALGLLLGLVDGHALAHGAIRRVLVAEHEVEEAAQEVLVTLARRIDRFEGRSRFTTWLWTVARNEARMLVRRGARHAAPRDDLDVAIPAGVRRMSSIIATRATLEDAIAALPDEFREALVLREVEQLSYDEIAARLDVPMGTVKSRIRRGRERVAESLASLRGRGPDA